MYLYDKTLPDAIKRTFDSTSIMCPEEIPKTAKPMSINCTFGKIDVFNNTSKLEVGEVYNMASSAYGASIVSCTNEHYGSSAQTLSLICHYLCLTGLSSRSHDRKHMEVICIRLAELNEIDAVEFDFTYFVHNNPVALEVLGRSQEGGATAWINVIAKTNVKAYAGNKRRFTIQDDKKFATDQIKVIVYPDGGFNRIKVFGKRQGK